MLRFTILLLAASCVYGLPKDLGGQEGRIVGGKKAQLGQFPYQAALTVKGDRHICSGVILSERWILTGQNCAEVWPVGNYSVKVGTTTLDKGGDQYPIERFIMHEGYDRETLKHNLALARTSSNIIFSDNVQPIPLPGKIEEVVLDTVVSGWGFQHGYPGGVISNELYYINLQTLYEGDCPSWRTTVDNKYEICTTNGPWQGVCVADEGAALVYNGQLVGMASKVNLCGFGGDVYVKVAGYADWITNRMD